MGKVEYRRPANKRCKGDICAEKEGSSESLRKSTNADVKYESVNTNGKRKRENKDRDKCTEEITYRMSRTHTVGWASSDDVSANVAPG